MEIILAIATILGGISAIIFFCDKYKKKNSHADNTEFRDKEKVIDNSWWESSELRNDLLKNDYEFRWSNQDKIENRLSQGYEVIFQTDHSVKTKYKLINESRQVLIGKQKT